MRNSRVDVAFNVAIRKSYGMFHIHLKRTGFRASPVPSRPVFGRVRRTENGTGVPFWVKWERERLVPSRPAFRTGTITIKGNRSRFFGFFRPQERTFRSGTGFWERGTGTGVPSDPRHPPSLGWRPRIVFLVTP